MYIILSPSKSLDFSADYPKMPEKYHISPFISQTKKLHKVMREHSQGDLMALMRISEKLAALNHTRFQNWNARFTKVMIDSDGTRSFAPALSAFTGDVYRGFDLMNYTAADWRFADDHIGILSGFYGILSPLTLMKPYRLEMGTRLAWDGAHNSYKNLYEFWTDTLTKHVDKKLQKGKTLINLASREYAKAIDMNVLDGEVITVDFKVKKEGAYKIIGILAKIARGEMANLIVKGRIRTPEKLKDLKPSGFRFNKTLSTDTNYVYTKKG